MEMKKVKLYLDHVNLLDLYSNVKIFFLDNEIYMNIKRII
jgi:hypothetical protein